MKPTGLALDLRDGGIGFHLRQPSQVEDAVWDAVEQAIEAGWTPQQFKIEVASAWEGKLLRDAKEAKRTLSQ